PRAKRGPQPALPGRRVRLTALQAEAFAALEGLGQAHLKPPPDRHPDRKARRSQHLLRSGQTVAPRLRRPGPHPHRLHAGPVRRRPVPTGVDLRRRRSDLAAGVLSVERPGLPALVLTPAPRPRRQTPRPRFPADRDRPRWQNRLGQGRPSQHLRSSPRRPRLQLPARTVRRQAWPDRNVLGLLLQPPRDRPPRRPERQGVRHQADRAGEVPEEKAQASRRTQARPRQGAGWREVTARAALALAPIVLVLAIADTAAAAGPPQIAETWATEVTATSANLRGRIDPEE